MKLRIIYRLPFYAFSSSNGLWRVRLWKLKKAFCYKNREQGYKNGSILKRHFYCIASQVHVKIAEKKNIWNFHLEKHIIEKKYDNISLFHRQTIYQMKRISFIIVIVLTSNITVHIFSKRYTLKHTTSTINTHPRMIKNSWYPKAPKEGWRAHTNDDGI